MDVFAIVNPLSGAGANPLIATERAALLMQRFAAAGITGTVHRTERRGHAAELAAAAVAQGARTVLAWGGDGTINEIGVPKSTAINSRGCGRPLPSASLQRDNVVHSP